MSFVNHFEYSEKLKKAIKKYMEIKEGEQTMNEIEFIRKKLPQSELLCQLAEEADELAQAALKLRRAMTGWNPTPVSEEEAIANVLEECADVSNCLVWLGFDTSLNRMAIALTMKEKCERCVERLGGVLDERD